MNQMSTCWLHKAGTFPKFSKQAMRIFMQLPKDWRRNIWNSIPFSFSCGSKLWEWITMRMHYCTGSHSRVMCSQSASFYMTGCIVFLYLEFSTLLCICWWHPWKQICLEMSMMWLAKLLVCGCSLQWGMIIWENCLNQKGKRQTNRQELSNALPVRLWDLHLFLHTSCRAL